MDAESPLGGTPVVAIDGKIIESGGMVSDDMNISDDITGASYGTTIVSDGVTERDVVAEEKVIPVVEVLPPLSW